MQKPYSIYSQEDRKKLDNLEETKEAAFKIAREAHLDSSKKEQADLLMAKYLKGEAECALLGTPTFTEEDGKITKIWNYLSNVNWFAYAPDEQAQYGTYAGLLILFDKVRYEGTTVVCKDILMSGQNSEYLGSNSNGIKHYGAGEYEIDIDQFVPLKLITPPEEIKVGDYFFATAFDQNRTKFKPIKSFSSNPWSGNIDSFVCNSSYSLRRANGKWRLVQR